MTRTPLLAFAAFVALAGSAAAQEQQQPPAPKPGPEHAALKRLEGTWDTLMTMADGKASKGQAIYKMDAGGFWLTSDFRGEFEGAPFQGKGLDSYDPAKKKYVAIWVDSMSTAPLVMEGTRDESTKTTTMNGEAPGPDGKPMKMKGVTKDIDADHMTFEMYTPGPDGKELKMFSIQYTRRK